jgi:hypothetical protein
MQFSPNLGIGDLLILRMKTRDVHVSTIVIRTWIVNELRRYCKEYFAFLEAFIPRLFPGVVIEYDSQKPSSPHEHIPIEKCSLYNDYAFQVPPSLPFEVPYVVFHTRVRFDEHYPNFIQKTLPLCANALPRLKSSYPIVLLGERDIEENVESVAWNIQSLYSILRKMSGVIDLTRNDAASNNTIEKFEHDAHIIHGAKFNVVFGYGGPLSLSLAFGKQTVGYIGEIRHKVLNDYSKHAYLHRDITEFLEVLQSKLM